MAVLNFGLKRIIKHAIVVCIGWLIVIVLLDLFKTNDLNNLLDEHIHLSIRPVRYLFLFPFLFIF